MPSSSDSKPDLRQAQPKNHETSAAFSRPSFWAALLLPFCLDLLVNGNLLTSVLGAAFWGLLITLSAWKPQVRDLRLRTHFSRAQIILWTLFITAWFYLYFIGNTQTTAWIQPLSRPWLVRIHAFLLAGASGLVFLFGLSSLAAHFQIKRIQSNSWQRRSVSKFFKTLPSLESLLKVSSMAVFWAFTGWGVGLALAFLTLVVAYGPGPESATSALSLASDPKILLTAFLWLVLLVAFLIQNRSQWNPKQRSHWLTGLSIVFWAFLALQAFVQASSFHEPVRWFLR